MGDGRTLAGSSIRPTGFPVALFLANSSFCLSSSAPRSTNELALVPAARALSLGAMGGMGRGSGWRKSEMNAGSKRRTHVWVEASVSD